MYFYVYKTILEDTGEFYIGRRKSKFSPELDPYMGSSKTWYRTLCKDIIKSLKKEILGVFLSEEDMCLAEIDYITNSIGNPMCKNAHIPSKGFYCKGHSDGAKEKMKGKVMVKDKLGNNLKVNKNDERYLRGDLVSINKNKIVVRDADGSFLSVDKNDERYLRGDLVSINKNKATVLNKEGKVIQVDVNDKDYQNGEYEYITKGNAPWNKGNTPIEEYKDGILIKTWDNLITLHEETKIAKSAIVSWIKSKKANRKGIEYRYKK
jgi:hypothetical protein